MKRSKTKDELDPLPFAGGLKVRATTWEKVSARRGRNDLPGQLIKNFDRLSRADVAKGISEAWTACEFPIAQLPMDVWKGLFDVVLERGQFIDEESIKSKSSELPTSLVLYRGAPAIYRGGMSWTSRFDKALWFAQRNEHFGLGPCHVYRVKARRSVVLARFHEARGEAEFVVDPAKLSDIVLVEPAEYDALVAEN